jgi:hypothetical protein
MLLVAGFEAQLNMASEAPIAKRTNVRTRRGLKTPDLNAGLIRIVCGSFPELGLDRDEGVFGTMGGMDAYIFVMKEPPGPECVGMSQLVCA